MVTNNLSTTEYKKTIIGLIPNEWDICQIGDEIKSLDAGVSVNSVDGTVNTGEIAILKTSSIYQGKFIPNESKKIIKKDIKRARLNPKKDSIIISRMNTPDLVGACAYIDKDYKNLYIPDRLWQTTSKINSKLDVKWLNYLLNSCEYKKIIKDMATGTSNSMKNITKGQILSLKIPFPNLDEQKAIATALSDMDDLIISLEKLISKKKLIKEGAMQDLLTGNRRLTGFSSEWITRKLGDLGEFSGAGIDKKINKNEEKVRLLNYLDVYQKDFIYSKDLWHVVTAPKYKLQQCSIQRGDIFFTPSSEMRDDIALSSLAIEDINYAGYSYHVVRFRFKENWDILFKAYIFKTKAFLDQAEMFCEGSGKRYVISLRKFRELEIKYLVDIKEQEAIGEILYSMSMEIEKLEKKLDKYKNIKSGMMEDLLTGKRRLV